MNSIYLTLSGLTIALLTLLQLQLGELLPWLHAPPQLVLMAGLLFTLSLPQPVGLFMAMIGSYFLDLWANTPFFQALITLLCLGPVWFLGQRWNMRPGWRQLMLWGLGVTFCSELLSALWFLRGSGAQVWVHLGHILPALLVYHLLLLSLLYLLLKPLLQRFSQSKF